MKKRKQRVQVPVIDPDIRTGLTREQVSLRTEAGWSNRTCDASLSEKAIIARHCFTFFNLVFAVLALILVLVQSSITNYGFLCVVVINLGIGIVQEIRAKRAVEKLTLVAEQTLKTVRGGETVEVRDRDLVRDDIVHFAGGNQICADGVVREGQLQVNESLLTGEPDTILKNPGDELLSGSFVTAGSAVVQLTRVGDDSFAARLSAEAKRDPRAAKSEMMRSLDVLVRFLSIVLVPLGVLYFISQYGSGVKPAAEETVAALVSLIPQGLYLLTSIAMAASAIKLSRDKVLVQDMNCIETLARVDVLCVDKTGTITEPGMEVDRLIPLWDTDPSYAEQVLGALYGTQEPENETARALARKYGGGQDWNCLRRIPFTSDTKWAGAVFEEQGAFLAGAPEFVLGGRYEEIEAQVRPWNETGCRVLLVAAYEGDLQQGKAEEARVKPLALVLLSGRIRETAPQTFRFFARQGVTIKVISGDNPLTVSRIACRAGIENGEKWVDCNRLNTPEEFLEAVDTYTVFGRVTPEKKRELVRALQAKKHTVAMTGDGVNDVLAMRQADCAVAMAGGAQAASQVAQLVLTESDFAAMPQIVNEGRRVINNIQRAAALFLVKNIFTLLLVLASLLTPLEYPFQPINLTVVMALTAGVPGFFFALEPNHERVKEAFLPGALRKALPGGIAAFVAAVVAQLLAGPQVHLTTVCTAALAVAGLLVLAQVSRPMTVLRGIVLGIMTALMAGAFLLPLDLFKLDLYSKDTALLTGGMVLLTAAVLVLLQLLANWIAGWKRR